jgi:bis(5'-nucleosidyl)-tetraphosphatase
MGKHAAAKSDKSAKTGAKARREFSAGFVLFRQTPAGPVFLLLDYGKHWDYPKGHLETGETAWRAAVRELREETGIVHVDRIGSFQRNMHYIFHSKKKGLVSKTVTYFLGQTRASTVTLSDEHEGFAWLPYDEALARLTFDTARQILTAAWTTMI